MAQLTIYKSSDTSAPTLSGTAGDLVALLDACLITGYGSKTAAGWTKPFTGASKAAFKLGAGTGFYLRVQDDGPGAGAAKEARITGYETMTDVDTGVNPFPTAALGVGGIAMLVARKSASADAVARSWIVVADSRTCYVFISTGDTAGTYYTFAFGDYYGLLSGDLYNCVIIGRNTENSAANAGVDRLGEIVNLPNSSASGQVIARGYTGLAGAVQIGFNADYVKQGGAGGYYGLVPFPNPADGAAILSRVWVHNPTTAPTSNLQGRLRGLWCPCHAIGSFTDGDVITGSGELAGKTFLMIKQVYSNPNPGVVAVETSNTVETN